jgi:protein-tyrosine kinase
MNIIQQATKRLEELQRAGVEVPWAAAGFNKPPLPEADAAPAPVTPLHPEQAAQPEKRSRQVALDLARLEQMSYCVPANARTPLAEEFRVIKRPLLKNASLEGETAIPRGNLIMVTSAVPGEGKTFTAVNLALSISMEVDRSVLLVDADMIRPAVLSRLGLAPERGLMDVLRDPSIDLSEVLLRTNVPKLSILPSGAGGSNATELLASDAMERLLDELATKYADRIVIFDGPPLLSATEANVLATHVGQVVVVVEADTTPREVVAEAFATVSQCQVVLPLLNKYSGRSAMGAYGYY